MKLVRDPMCGTFVAPGESFAFRAGGETHYFCSVECRERFRKSA
jgi:YHS domain-containing protein